LQAWTVPQADSMLSETPATPTEGAAAAAVAFLCLLSLAKQRK